MGLQRMLSAARVQRCGRTGQRQELVTQRDGGQVTRRSGTYMCGEGGHAESRVGASLQSEEDDLGYSASIISSLFPSPHRRRLRPTQTYPRSRSGSLHGPFSSPEAASASQRTRK